MFKFIMRALLAFSLLLHCVLGFAGGAVNPITVDFENGTIDIEAGGVGSAHYLVKVNAAVVPAGYPLTMRVKNLPSWVTQDTDSTSACTTTTTTCGASFNLSAGEYCCLMLELDGTHLTQGSYSLAPLVATTPTPTYQGQAGVTAVTVGTVGPTSISISPNTPQILVADNNNPLVFTITNIGSVPATDITATQPARWSGVTIVAALGCANLTPHDTCTFTLTSTTPNLAKRFTVKGSNTGSAIASPYVATRIKGGLVFFKSGTNSGTAKVVSETDNGVDIIWSSNGSGGTPAAVSYDLLPGIDETSTPASGSPTYAQFSDFFTTTYPTLGLPPASTDFRQCDG